MKTRVVILLVFCMARGLYGQDTILNISDSVPDRFFILENVDRDGEVLPEIAIDEVTVSGRAGMKERFKWWRYRRLVYNVKIVYPFALIVRDSLGTVNDALVHLETDKERRKYLKEFEKSVFGQYEHDMRQMTITQGKILIKLIDRETQNTSYDLIKEYRGSFTAAFWQGIARIFGSNLKATYDPMGEDYLIEKVIYEIEAGRL